MHRFHFTRFQVLVHLACLAPLAALVVGYFTHHLTADPVQAITQRTGQDSIRIMLVSLACTPLVTVLGFRPALSVRRALGLYAFFYAMLHFLTYAVLDYGLLIGPMVKNILEKWYLIVGVLALLALIPLAVTSTQSWIKRLGRTWRRLHWLVYPAAVLMVLHYFLEVKADIRLPLFYGGILLVLLSLRLPSVRRWFSNHRPTWMEPVNQFLSK
jgi:sulfoxide reductase heme-binding subunit YedZ